MNVLQAPKNKLLVASAALAALLTVASVNGFSATMIARSVIAVAAVSGLGFWLIRAQKLQPAKKFEFAPRMSVVSRAVLSQRTGLAMVEIDGRAFLVVHGDGFAEICAAHERKTQARARAPRATDSFPKAQTRGTESR